jgi:hypothetical protein
MQELSPDLQARSLTSLGSIAASAAKLGASRPPRVQHLKSAPEIEVFLGAVAQKHRRT